MCIDNDLFGSVIVRKSDVDIWLKVVSRLDDTTAPNRVKQYCKQNDIANKIKNAKLNGTFYQYQEIYEQEEKELINQKLGLIFPTKYKEISNNERENFPCEAGSFHVCDNAECKTFKRLKKQAYSKKMYLKRKLERETNLTKKRHIKENIKSHRLHCARYNVY